MTPSQQHALNHIISTTRTLLTEKYKNRKRLRQHEVWKKATTLRDLSELEAFLSDQEADQRALNFLQNRKATTLPPRTA